ncbi:MAG: ATP synthase F1 subunit gamma [Candidatus Pacebacteria bacterium CG_4_10_14_3_um_filter_34_15]|nr:ATP synthase F1 subunit gamma [Candidatus Pacearchaeota archaeon]NCQ65557.1 ATP synthase F1 subunit gamma [Candidatus Paceibacterota bacterium]OIO44819.1 MAG: ATP synthase F1 subunit gamma [Candidatus Pacebacteria bacterium CG1_02_43_31]PIQ81301.1 MAG: ATP synthase F1 subunit gamma [Candidatus Pacebacteria bacterium CG11_big_fil_rev_8_21_14_0_20_34_55]PIX81128.1 MAG: ATP synthase F1 subunit gamma [Candidatus Pacebacteria bacterium CG_4_10_14_3_um_filter_34_15]PJC43847.1 MAG: ATP synthase F1
MSSARQIKQKIKTAKNISKITKAMEMVSASKMRRAQIQALATRPYTRALQESLSTLASTIKTNIHPFLVSHPSGVDVAIIISTDKGLCGGLNLNLFKSTIEWQKKHRSGKLILVGKKAVVFAKMYGLNTYAQFTDFPDIIRTSEILPIATIISKEYLNESFKSVSIIYMDFISTLVQRVKTINLLPLPKNDETNYSELVLVNTKSKIEYIFEPSPEAILDDLLNYYLENTLYQSFLEAKASEHSARMVAMKNASDNAGELMSELQLQFNKSRQAGITSELLDITTAVLAQRIDN